MGAVPDDDACLEPPDKKDILLTINFECFEGELNFEHYGHKNVRGSLFCLDILNVFFFRAYPHVPIF